ncbi:MAG: hypothetical protein WAM04_17810 [Candidatus Sulfotelmatobacter sp.]
MRSIAGRVVLTAVASSLIVFMWCAYRGLSPVAAQQHTPVTATRLYTGADGLTHVDQVNIDFAPVAGEPSTVEESEPVKTASSYVVRAAPGFFSNWHNADKRRYVITISGRAEIEVAGGQKTFAQPGRILQAEDLTGKGHTFRVVSTDDWVALFVDFAQ